nr:hypothetical protein [uncultured archaeon]
MSLDAVPHWNNKGGRESADNNDNRGHHDSAYIEIAKGNKKGSQEFHGPTIGDRATQLVPDKWYTSCHILYLCRYRSMIKPAIAEPA